MAQIKVYICFRWRPRDLFERSIHIFCIYFYFEIIVVMSSISNLTLSLQRSHAQKIIGQFQDLFAWLPLATLIDSKILICHGGISDKTDLTFLDNIARHKVSYRGWIAKLSINDKIVSPHPGGCFTKTKINFKLDFNMAGSSCH